MHDKFNFRNKKYDTKQYSKKGEGLTFKLLEYKSDSETEEKKKPFMHINILQRNGRTACIALRQHV